MGAFAARPDDGDVVVFMGYGPLEGEIRARSATCGQIRFQPAIPPAELLEWTASADFGICFIEDSCRSYRWCLPNKLFEYVMAGIPVIASDTPSVARVIRTEGLGVVAEGSDARDLDRAITRIRSIDPAGLQAAAAAARRRYSWESQEAAILESAGLQATGRPTRAPSAA